MRSFENRPPANQLLVQRKNLRRVESAKSGSNHTTSQSSPDFKLSGRSGFDHKFDFGLPRTSRKPQRVLQAVNNLTKNQALSCTLSFAFAVADVRVMRAEPLQAFTFLNDVEHPPNDDNLAAIRAYDVGP